jgi:hypothetical protein
MIHLKKKHSTFICLMLGLGATCLDGANPPTDINFSTEVKRPDMSREARDTAPKYRPLAHVRITTKEEAGNYRKRDLLTSRYSVEDIREAIQQADPYRPFPPAGDPAYKALPEEERVAIIKAAEQFLDYEWPTLSATLYLHFYETGSNTAYHEAYFKRVKTLETLIYAEILESEGRFARDIANGLWAVCEQTSWATPAHLNVEIPGAGLPSPDHPILALAASEIAALLATAEYFLADALDKVHPVIRQRMRREVKLRTLQPFLERTDYWWMAYEKPFTNNWNPWITSNYLLCALMFSTSEDELMGHISKAIDVLDHFIDVYPEDGGCEEGPAYWAHAGGRLMDCLDLLHEVTGGYMDVYDVPLIREMGNFMWYSHIAGDWYVNFADAFAKYTPDPGTLFRYGNAVGSDNLMAFATGTSLAPYLSTWRLEYIFMRQLPNLFARGDLESYDQSFSAQAFVALNDLETAYIRQSENPAQGFYLAAKGGYNAESHNHNDVGNFIVFLDGEPLLIDTGVGTYTSKTFSEERYDIWSMQSSYHNLPDINGQAQPHMIQWRSNHFEARNSSSEATVEIGIETAYPPEANLSQYRRLLRLDRTEGSISLNESLTFLDSGNRPEGNRVDFHLMTHHMPSAGSQKGQLLLTHPETGSARAVINYPSDLKVNVTRILLEDARMLRSWGDTLYRIRLSAAQLASGKKHSFQFKVERPEGS